MRFHRYFGHYYPTLVAEPLAVVTLVQQMLLQTFYIQKPSLETPHTRTTYRFFLTSGTMSKPFAVFEILLTRATLKQTFL